MLKHRPRRFEIPRCAMAHLGSGAHAPAWNDGRAEICHRQETAVRVLPASSCLLLLALAFARGVTGVALGLLLGLQRGQPGGLFFLFRAILAASTAAASASRRFCSAFSASFASLALARAAAWASRSAWRRFTSGSSGPGLARNLFKMSCRACIAAFWRSAKFGSLNPLIDEALSLSLSGVGRTRRAEWRLGK